MEDQNPGTGVSVSCVRYYITFTILLKPLKSFLGINETLTCMLDLLYNTIMYCEENLKLLKEIDHVQNYKSASHPI